MADAHILVVGGSLGGLMAANVLHRAGWRVSVLEKAAGSLDGRGAGIVTHRALLGALRAAGVQVDATLGVRVATRVALAADGTVQARTERPQVLTSWSRLYALLRDALPAGCLHGASAVASVAQDADGVQVTCDDGRVFAGALVIASDGIRSTVRAQFAPQARAGYAGYVAWRGVTDEAALSAHTRATLFEHFGFGLPPGEQMIGYPVAGPGNSSASGPGNSTAPGERRYNFVWYRPADEQCELPRLLTDADGVLHAHGIAPHKVHPREVAAMREAAHALLAPQWAEVVDRCEQPFLQPIYDLASERIAFGRVALMGDAAFVARPHAGMGVTKAGEDALALADALSRHGATAQALQVYQAARLASGRAVVERGRRLGAYLEARANGQPAQRSAIEVLNETAVDLADGCEPAVAASFPPPQIDRAIAHPT